jgi:hypothetical protein
MQQTRHPRALALVRRVALAATCAALAACGAMGMQPGMTRNEVIARMGAPTRTVTLPTGGQRLQYFYQPGGQDVVMVDLDAAGRLVAVRQPLNEADFARISTRGDWTREDVEREFGPPGMVGMVASWNGPVLGYRWRGGMVAQLSWIYLDNAGTVRRAHAALDPQQFRD